MIRIFIADDHPLVREGVKRILEETPGFCLVGEASTAQEQQTDFLDLVSPVWQLKSLFYLGTKLVCIME